MKRAGVVAMLLVLAVPAWAKGWDPMDYTLRLNAYGTSDAFPGSLASAPDKGLDPSLELGSNNRFLKVYKVGVNASVGGHVQQQFANANYLWYGLGTNVRRGATVFTLDAEYIPQRNKFPADPEEGGAFHRWQGIAGVRRTLGTRLKLRVEGTFDHEVFADSVNRLRDARGRELFAQLVFSPVKTLDLRVEGSIAHDRTESIKYRKDSRWLGAGLVRTSHGWRSDLAVRSGTRRYDEAVLGNSNFKRRDQWLELRARVTRELKPGLVAAIGATFTDQTSSRIDRNYDAHQVSFGLEWSGGGK